MIKILADQENGVEVEWAGDANDLWNEILTSLHTIVTGIFADSFRSHGKDATNMIATMVDKNTDKILDAAYDDAYKEVYGELPENNDVIEGQIEMEFE